MISYRVLFTALKNTLYLKESIYYLFETKKERERARAHERGGEAQGEGEVISSRFPTELRAWPGLGLHLWTLKS